MKYQYLERATFLERKNRFVAELNKDGQQIFAHVPNTGRCKELLVPGVTALVYKAENPQRKYPYTLWAVYKGERLVHIDSAGANQLTAEALAKGVIGELRGAEQIQREKTFGTSRFDFRFELNGQTCFMEVKGVTLETDGIARFPDAPTERGARHLRELTEAKKQGYGAYVLFVVQMQGVTEFRPHWERDRAFAEALINACKNGVTVLCYDTVVTPEEIALANPVAINLEE